jgi:hypothetical protein
MMARTTLRIGALLVAAAGVAGACSAPYEGGGRMPIPGSDEDSGSPFAGVEPIDTGVSGDFDAFPEAQVPE